MLGKSRYYDQGLFQSWFQLHCTYPNSSKIYEAKIYENQMRLGTITGDENISKLLESHVVKTRFCKCKCAFGSSLNLEQKTVLW
jgi:hypothetical protein